MQVAMGLVGLFYVGLISSLYTDLANSKWLLEMKDECEPMFLSWFIALGPFLLLAARKPSVHRSLIAFAAVPELVPCFGNDRPNCTSAGSTAFIGITDVVVFGVSSSLPSNCRNILITLKAAAFGRSLMNGRHNLPLFMGGPRCRIGVVA